MEMDDLQVDPLCHENEEELALSDEEVVVKIMKFAKLDLSQVSPNVQQLYFSPAMSGDSIKLLELNDQTLACLESGNSLVFKGEGNENVVLCTDKETYEVKDAEISNSLLIVPDLKLDEQVKSVVPSASEPREEELNLRTVHIDAISHSYFELKPVKPKLHKITELLLPSAYRGPECEEETVINRICRGDLEKSVLASQEEIDRALSKLTIIEIEGFVRLIDFDYLSRVLGSITALLEENSWLFDDFVATEVVSGLKDLYPEAVIESILSHFGQSTTKEASTSWSLDEDKVGPYPLI